MRSSRARLTVVTMSHFAHVGSARPGIGLPLNSWWYGIKVPGGVVLKGTTVQRFCRPQVGATTTTGRHFAISGALNPLKSHTTKLPGVGGRWMGTTASLLFLFYFRPPALYRPNFAYAKSEAALIRANFLMGLWRGDPREPGRANLPSRQ